MDSAPAQFRALLITESDGKTSCSLRDLSRAELPVGDVLIAVAYSSLNYKDALGVTGRGRVIRRFPMVPGIDLAGRVLESNVPEHRAGDSVVLTGGGAGELFWGGYAQLARVPATYLVHLPRPFTLEQSMGIGTAGFTAMQCVLALEEHGVAPGGKPVVVTGASGGVGSIAVAILKQLGYGVIASTGKPQLHDYLRSLGASEFLERDVLSKASGKPLDSERWAGAVDTVGGQTLASLLRGTAYGGSVAACGLAGGTDLPATVLPFILRGVNLLGINSVDCPPQRREVVWQRLARDLRPEKLAQIATNTVGLEDVPEAAERLLAGQTQGRTIVKL